MSRLAFPYRTAPSGVVIAEEWTLLVDDTRIELADSLADWDYRMDLDLRRSATIDLDLLRTSTGLPENAKLSLAAVWTATGSSLKGAAQRVPFDGNGTRAINLNAVLPGTQLGGLLTLETVLTLAEYCDGGAPAAPRRAGSVLWRDQRTVRLQGDAPQFPIAVVDFSKTQFPENAAWYVQISGDFETATMGALLLLINERKTALVTAFRNAAKPKSIDRVLLSATYADVARTMVEHALREPEFHLDSTYPTESMGSTLQSLIRTLFPEVSITHLRRRYEQSPHLFVSELQHAVRIFEDV